MRISIPGLLVAAASLLLPVRATFAKSPPEYWQDTKDYFTAPLHWDARQWTIASGVVAGIAASHALDSTVRDQFAPIGSAPSRRGPTRDVLPLAALVGGTFAVGVLGNNQPLLRTGWDMGEAMVFTSVSTSALKAAFGRQRPRQTASPHQWREGGSSFPSGHTSVTFAAAQVLADELPENKWGWRMLAYGLAGATAYARMDSNAHWLSDTVAGAALGIAGGRFISNRAQGSTSRVSFSVAPIEGGAMLTFAVDMH
jgi:membrane-associated phospholipid phosphatase